MQTKPTALLMMGLITACSQNSEPLAAQTSTTGKGQSSYVEGTDYMILERVRFMDADGFQAPAEAFSVLVPKGWKHEGGVHWKSMQECRGELVQIQWSASSPDGAIRYVSLPHRTWGWASDPMMQQSMQMQAQSGGCGVGNPISAEQYLLEVFGPRELQGARISDVKENTAVLNEMNQHSAQRKAQAEQFGGQVEVRNSAVTARLRWNDGTEGIAFCNVGNLFTTTQDMYTGAYQKFSTSVSSERSYIRYPAARREEAEQFVATLKASYRTNPAWKQATDNFFAQLSAQQNVIHRQRMEAIDQQTRANTAAHNARMGEIQRQGAANTAAHDQRMANMDGQMRSWENQQDGQDRMHSAFVKTIREVETYRDGGGTVELSSGYDQAWSRGDGTYILSNKAGFDPAAVFLDQNWQEMKRTDQ